MFSQNHQVLNEKLRDELKELKVSLKIDREKLKQLAKVKVEMHKVREEMKNHRNYSFLLAVIIL